MRSDFKLLTLYVIQYNKARPTTAFRNSLKTFHSFKSFELRIPDSCYDFDMRAVWKHAMACSVAISALLLGACKVRQGEKNIDTVTPPLAAETEALWQAYAAFNRNDIPAAVAALDPQIEWTEPPEFPGGGITYHGHAGVQT